MNEGEHEMQPGATVLEVPHPEPFRPVGERERIHTLDVLRGFALFGIFIVNMQFFSMPFARIMFDPAMQDGPFSEKLAAAIIKGFFEYKFISLFSLLFGIGFVVQLAKAQTRQQSEKAIVPLFVRRLLILLGFGLIHAFGMWYGDILVTYSIVGFGLLLFGFMRPKTLLILAGSFLAVGIFLSVCSGSAQYMMLSSMAEQAEQVYTEADAVVAAGDAPTGWDAIAKAQGDPMNPYWAHGEATAFKEGPLADALIFRAVLYGYMVMAGLFSYFWHVIAMFLLGAAIMKLNFFATTKKHWHKRLAFVALPIGLLFESANALHTLVGGAVLDWTVIALMPVREVGSVVLCLGYVGVWCVMVDNGWLKWITKALANVGRMALSNYILQTLVATFIMYWWGLGWFNDVSRVAQIGLVVAIFLAQLLISAIWLQFFRIGPLEWLWRTLTYVKRQPLLREAKFNP